MADLRGAVHFLAQRHAGDHHRLGGNLGQLTLGLRLRFGQSRCILHIQAFFVVDHDIVDTGLDDLADLVFAGNQEAVAYEGVGHPVATQVLDVHAYLQL